jgi:molybdate transport system permease protein
MPPDLLWLSLRAASAATAAGLPLGVWLGCLVLARPRAAWLVSLPLCFPPAIVCAYFLAPRFTWQLAAAAGALYAVPLVGRSASVAFRGVGIEYVHAARSLGASEWRVLWRVLLPLAGRPVIAAAGLAFARVASESALVMAIAWYTRI